MQDKARDAEGKAQVQNQKMMENREAHQAHMLENQQKLDLDRQKAGMAMQLHQNKQQDMASRANERQMAAAQKRNNGIGGLG
jgi:hypothetical protein